MKDDTQNHLTYLAWVRHIVDTHRTRAWDGNRTPQQETEEERLNELWDDLDDTQHQRLWGLSADLNTLRDNEVVIASDWPPMSKAALTEALQAALDRQQWDQVLELLRRPPQVMPRDERDALRGNCWAGLGHQDVAALFAENAVSSL